MSKVLSVDLGASSGRAMLVRHDSRTMTIEEVHRFFNHPVTLNGSLYWDALRLMDEITAGLRKCGQEPAGKVDSIAIDSWGVDFALLDRRGDLLGNPYHYRDTRTNGMIALADSMLGQDALYNATGVQSMWFNTSFQLLSMAHGKSPLLDLAGSFLMIPDLMHYYLTGEKRCEYTAASTTQLMNPDTCQWDRDLIHKLGIPEAIFPKVMPTNTIVGTLTKRIAAEAGMPAIPVIAAATHDTASAIAAIPCEPASTVAFISCGTWSLLGAEVASPVRTQQAKLAGFSNEGGVQNRVNLLKNIVGLWILQECRRQWEIEGTAMSYADMLRRAEEAPPLQCFIDTEDELFSPPDGMPARILAYCKARSASIPRTVGEMVRCVLESICMRYREAISQLQSLLDKPIRAIHIIGGGSQNTLLCQGTADATGIPVVAGPVEGTALGNALCQLIALGRLDSIEQGRKLIGVSFPPVIYEPRHTQAWDDAYAAYKKSTELPV